MMQYIVNYKRLSFINSLKNPNFNDFNSKLNSEWYRRSKSNLNILINGSYGIMHTSFSINGMNQSR